MFGPVLNKYKNQGVLLLDDLFVKSTSNCWLDFCQATKDPTNPIIKPTEIWEGNGCTTWGGTILYDEETERYRMYYGTFEDGGTHRKSHYRGGAIESVDGLNWVRPTRYETVYKGVPTKYYCRMEGDELGPCGAEAVFDPRPECPPEERYKALGCRRFIGGIMMKCSADGIDWHYWSDEPIWYACSDIIHPFWDERLQKFVVYYKLWKLYAEEKDDTTPGGFRPMTALTHGGIETEELPDGTTSISGTFVVLHPETKAEIVKKTFIVRSGVLGEDDGGGSHLSGVWHMRRVVLWAVSDDFVHWEHEQEVLDTDELDRPASNIQLAQVFQMGGYYLAFLNVHDERGHFDQQFAFSHDGIHWKRPWRGNVLSHGAPGSFDYGMAEGMQLPIVDGAQMILYYGGTAAGHAGPATTIGIGRAVMRKDGFACWKAYGEKIGFLETVALPRKDDALYLNIDSEGGWLTAALLDQQGNIIPGYSHEDCQPIREDSASHTDCVVAVRWNGSTALPVENTLCVQLRFVNSAIYSVRI